MTGRAFAGRATLAGLIAFAASAAAGPAAMRLARRLDLLDRPGSLKPQAEAVPYLGGLAVAAGLAASAPLLRPGHRSVLLPLLCALALGTADDAWDLPAPARLLGEAVIGLLVAGSSAPRRTRVARVLVTVASANALNLVDGADSLAAGSTLLGALGQARLLRQRPSSGMRPATRAALADGPGVAGPAAAPGGSALAGSLAGAAAGFLLWNRPPARLYLGDGGAYLLGTGLAILAADVARVHSPTGPGGVGEGGGRAGGGGACKAVAPDAGWPGALLPLAYPIAEAAFAVVRRLRAGVAPWQGDRAHLYDRLAERGWAAPLPAAACLSLEAACALLGATLPAEGGRRAGWARLGYAAVGLAGAGALAGTLRLDP